MIQNMKLMFFEFFTKSGLDCEDFIYFHYLTDRFESTKFVHWNRELTAQIVANYDPGLVY